MDNTGMPFLRRIKRIAVVIYFGELPHGVASPSRLQRSIEPFNALRGSIYHKTIGIIQYYVADACASRFYLCAGMFLPLLFSNILASCAPYLFRNRLTKTTRQGMHNGPSMDQHMI